MRRTEIGGNVMSKALGPSGSLRFSKVKANTLGIDIAETDCFVLGS